MNRIRQLSGQLNRMNALIAEELDTSKGPLAIPKSMYSTMTEAEVAEMRRELPVVNMCYLREVIVKFISFPRGSSERTYMVPVMKSLLSLGERELRVRMEESLENQIIRGDMSYKAPSRIPMDQPLIRSNHYIDSTSLLNAFKSNPMP